MNSPAAIPDGTAKTDSRCNYLSFGPCNKCGREHDGGGSPWPGISEVGAPLPAAIPAGPSSISEEVRAQFEAWMFGDTEDPSCYEGYDSAHVDALWAAWLGAAALSAARIRELEEALEDMLDLIQNFTHYQHVRVYPAGENRIADARSTLKKD